MATINIDTTITAGSYHKRSTGITGQILASTVVERKLERVEALYRELHGVRMGRVAFYNFCLEHARSGKAEVGGYIQYMAQDVAGIVLDKMHKELGKQVRLNRVRKKKKYERGVTIDLGMVDLNTWDLKQGKRGRRAKVAA